MTDLVVTVPMDLWEDWIDEGDAAGSPETGEEWGFFVGPSWRTAPPIGPGDRLYIVAHSLLRGYAPVTRVADYEGQWAIGRKGGGVAVTLETMGDRWVVDGFRGWRKRWWERRVEVPFPEWRTDGVMTTAERRRYLAQQRVAR